jgi:hypothetical protein
VAEIQGTRELGGSRGGSPKLDAPSREWRRIHREDQRSVHPRGGQVAEIRTVHPRISLLLGGSRGKSPKFGCSKSRVAKPREDQDRPSEEDRWQRSRDLATSEVREVRAQSLDAPSREWRSHERIRTVHPRRTGGRDPGISLPRRFAR